MNQKKVKMTTAQFARLHGVNKRTLHYYDSIGLFAPKEKGDNNYRYYDSSQSLDFDYILMLKELGMSIEEIMNYVKNPNPRDFIAIVDEKSSEIEQRIAKLKETRQLLQTRKQQLLECGRALEKGVHIINCGQEKLAILPYVSQEDDMQEIFAYIKREWDSEQYRAGVGSYISIEKVRNKAFEEYDGLFSPVRRTRPGMHLAVRPRGRYLCCYVKGTWDRLPLAYQSMISYAEQQGLRLTGYAYEMGMNDFVIREEGDYITRITVGIQE